MADLRAAGCDLLTITQYLRPSVRHHPIDRWVPPEEFDELGQEARQLGFAGVMAGLAGALVVPRGRLYRQAVDRQAVDRQAVDRQAVDRQAVDRQAVDRQVSA